MTTAATSSDNERIVQNLVETMWSKARLDGRVHTSNDSLPVTWFKKYVKTSIPLTCTDSFPISHIFEEIRSDSSRRLSKKRVSLIFQNIMTERFSESMDIMNESNSNDELPVVAESPAKFSTLSSSSSGQSSSGSSPVMELIAEEEMTKLHQENHEIKTQYNQLKTLYDQSILNLQDERERIEELIDHARETGVKHHQELERTGAKHEQELESVIEKSCVLEKEKEAIHTDFLLLQKLNDDYDNQLSDANQKINALTEQKEQQEEAMKYMQHDQMMMKLISEENSCPDSPETELSRAVKKYKQNDGELSKLNKTQNDIDFWKDFSEPKPLAVGVRVRRRSSFVGERLDSFFPAFVPEETTKELENETNKMNDGPVMKLMEDAGSQTESSEAPRLQTDRSAQTDTLEEVESRERIVVQERIIYRVTPINWIAKLGFLFVQVVLFLAMIYILMYTNRKALIKLGVLKVYTPPEFYSVF